MSVAWGLFVCLFVSGRVQDERAGDTGRASRMGEVLVGKDDGQVHMRQ